MKCQAFKKNQKPIVLDLFCGLGGWSEAFLAEGYRAIGFDIEAHDYGNGGYPGELVLRDIRSISGAELLKQYGVPACIVASPPCQRYSYMAMPWSLAKKQRQKILDDKTGKLLAELNDLFHQCFRIQREVSEAAGHYVPMIIENVRGAQEWVGKSRWNFGSYHLWGDVPALMPIPIKRVIKQKGSMTPRKERWCRDGIAPLKGEGNKTVGMNWSDRTKRGQNFTRIAGQQVEGVKQSKSKARKQASAEIAKIPPVLAQWIAKTFKPKL
jgi:site-specific DNA-cytosine methylase